MVTLLDRSTDLKQSSGPQLFISCLGALTDIPELLKRLAALSSGASGPISQGSNNDPSGGCPQGCLASLDP